MLPQPSASSFTSKKKMHSKLTFFYLKPFLPSSKLCIISPAAQVFLSWRCVCHCVLCVFKQYLIVFCFSYCCVKLMSLWLSWSDYWCKMSSGFCNNYLQLQLSCVCIFLLILVFLYVHCVVYKDMKLTCARNKRKFNENLCWRVQSHKNGSGELKETVLVVGG